MYCISKEFHFEYAHKLTMDYTSACKNLHGHSAKVILKLWSEHLDKYHMIVDFVNLRKVQDYIDTHFDHALILNGKDVEWVKFAKEQQTKVFILENGIDPTSEVMARILWDKIAKMLVDSAVLYWDSLEVIFYETAKNYASYKAQNTAIDNAHTMG